MLAAWVAESTASAGEAFVPEARDLLLTHYAEPAERDEIIPVNTICVPEVRHYGLRI